MKSQGLEKLHRERVTCIIDRGRSAIEIAASIPKISWQYSLFFKEAL